jgi:hypothetical protein
MGIVVISKRSTSTVRESVIADVFVGMFAAKSFHMYKFRNC